MPVVYKKRTAAQAGLRKLRVQRQRQQRQAHSGQGRQMPTVRLTRREWPARSRGPDRAVSAAFPGRGGRRAAISDLSPFPLRSSTGFPNR